MDELEDVPMPEGELSLRLLAQQQDANLYGDISGGWLVAQMDLAAEMAAGRLAQGRTATVAIHEMDFLSPVKIGSQVNIYTRVLDVGHSSMRIQVEVWILPPHERDPRAVHKVTEALFVMVAIDKNGRIRAVPTEL